MPNARPATVTDRPKRRLPHAVGIGEVVEVSRPTPRLARIVLTGPVLREFPDEEPGEIVTFVWPAPGADEVVLPVAGWRYPEGTPEQHAKNFTVRALDADRTALTVDIVLHEPPGPATAWALAARPGDRIGLAGPRIHYAADPDAAWTVLCGDETALPSIAATLETLPAGHPTFVFVEVADAAEEQRLETAADLDLRWIHRGAAPPHDGDALLDAVRGATFPDGPGKVWAAGEASVVRRLREHLRDERGLPIGPLQAIGYWKHRATPEDVEADLEGEDLPG